MQVKKTHRQRDRQIDIQRVGDRPMDGSTDRQTDTATILKTFHGSKSALYRNGATKNEYFERPIYISNI